MTQYQIPQAAATTVYTVVVTGGASGVGEACVRKFFELGHRVIISDVDRTKGEALEAELSASQSLAAESSSGESSPSLQEEQRAYFIYGDFGKETGSKAFAEIVLEKFGKVDILINNAGIQSIHPIEEFPESKWRLIMEIMLNSPFLLTQAFLPGMYDQKFGRIINMGSIHSLIASPFKSAYVTAKHGLFGLTKVTAWEGGPHNVTANCVCPSYVKTPLVEAQIASQAKTRGISEEEVEKQVFIGENVAIKRILLPFEVAEYVAFLALSQAGGSITGTSQTIDCGWTSR